MGLDGQVDHIQPRYHAGSNRRHNLQAAHASCNSKKSSKWCLPVAEISAIRIKREPGLPSSNTIKQLTEKLVECSQVMTQDEDVCLRGFETLTRQMNRALDRRGRGRSDGQLHRKDLASKIRAFGRQVAKQNSVRSSELADIIAEIETLKTQLQSVQVQYVQVRWSGRPSRRHRDVPRWC